MEEKQIKVKDWNVHYIKSGHGPKLLLCFTGGFGNGTTFKPIMEGLDPDQFTIVAWDTPGFGKSRPPNREYHDHLLEEDVEYAYEFIKALKISNCSVLGSCWGGKVAIVLAAEHPELVESLILVNTSALLLPSEMENWLSYSDTKKWSPKLVESIKVSYNYTIEDVKALMDFRIKVLSNLYNKNNGAICVDYLSLIKCKTLILSGGEDVLLDKSHATHLETNINNSRLHVYPAGGHYIHMRYSEDFNERVRKFLLELP